MGAVSSNLASTWNYSAANPPPRPSTFMPASSPFLRQATHVGVRPKNPVLSKEKWAPKRPFSYGAPGNGDYVDK